ncbi:hypothetical protein ULMS_05640 [Patiriisocius marinistellae]|uniref:Uncharacterized protein n=1 Tax=Patiriisocius marinistellae TaxID=2494560 RepID=A0A5J4FY74_9FLAO|nr:hypothetical protein [Patiriisocius marinistellae]GEQ85056.1 hypothetical protein ULMS_05640 [Patiriisocius marinistellae]
MKTLKSILVALFVTATVQNTIAQETNYLEVLDPIYLTKENQSFIELSSYEQLNQELIKKSTFVFSREIRQAHNNNELLILNGNENAVSLEKANYLKALRKAANRSDNVEEFYNYLSNSIPGFNATTINDNDLFKLFEVAKKNTTNGKLNNISADLSWL